ncbi:MAG: restriction endonuclease [Deltaproteobacteria bacterium]|nr:restriction endonuclease [Deltaproteobacteria bacterium]
MHIGPEELERRYASTSTKDLLELYHPGNLTDLAKQILEKELKRRGIDVTLEETQGLAVCRDIGMERNDTVPREPEPIPIGDESSEMKSNKGHRFEVEVQGALLRALHSQQIDLSATSWKMERQKKYYSHTRRGMVRVDIAIELFLLMGQSEDLEPSSPTIIWIWECKNYTKPIPVGELEEFHAVLQGIGADRTKGTVISSGSPFEKSAIEFARYNGIGLARLMPGETIQNYLHASLGYGYFAVIQYLFELTAELRSAFKGSNPRLRKLSKRKMTRLLAENADLLELEPNDSRVDGLQLYGLTFSQGNSMCCYDFDDILESELSSLASQKIHGRSHNA